MKASSRRNPSFHGIFRSVRLLAYGSLTALVGFSCFSTSFGQVKTTGPDEALHPEDFAEIYLDRYFEPSSDLKLSDSSRDKAEALARYSIGRMLENDGQPDAAIDSFEKVLKLQPREVMLARKTAHLLARNGQVDKARELLETVLKQNPGKPRAYIVLSELLYTYFSDNPKDRDQSLQLAEQAVAKFPNEPEVYENLVRRHLVEGNRNEAREVMDQATARENKDPRFWLRLGQLAQSTWPTRTSGTQEPVLVNSIYEKALLRAGNEVAVVEAVGDYYLRSNQPEKAQKVFEDIIKSNPDRLDVRRKLVAVFLAQSQPEKAIATLKGIVEINPQDAGTLRELAIIYRAKMVQTLQKSGLRQPEEDDPDLIQAAQYLSQALQVGKGESPEYIEAGRLFRYAGKTEKSVSILEDGAYLFPESPSFPWEIAESYTSGDEWEKAIVPLERTVKLATQSQPEMLDEFFYFRFGVAFERSGKIEKAAVKFRKAIEKIGERDPNDPAPDSFVALVYNYLGYTWVENDMNIDEGGELIKSALALDPESSAITDSLGWFYFKKEKFEDSRKTLLKAKAMMDIEAEQTKAEGGTPPELDGVIFDHIAQAHWMTGYKKEAIEYMELAVAAEIERKEEFEKRLKEYRSSEPPVSKPEESKPAVAPVPEAEEIVPAEVKKAA